MEKKLSKTQLGVINSLRSGEQLFKSVTYVTLTRTKNDLMTLNGKCTIPTFRVLLRHGVIKKKKGRGNEYVLTKKWS